MWIGAFVIGEYPEGVAVMLFYAVGEVFQTLAVKRAKANIKSLLDQRPDEVTVLRSNQPQMVKAETVNIDEIVQLKPGEKLGLDGILLSETAADLAFQLNMSSKYLSDCLKQLTGQTAQQLIHEKLIEHAKDILTTTELSVSEIAYQLGFEYPQSFKKLFKNKTNQTPREYRQSFN